MMRRWLAAILAVLFLSTATLHVLAHRGDLHVSCDVCHVQQAGAAAAAPPAVVFVAAPDIAVPVADAPRAPASRAAAAAARAPPVLPA